MSGLEVGMRFETRRAMRRRYQEARMATIHITQAGTLGAGDLVCNVDNDDLLTDEAVNEAYAVADQEWHRVRKVEWREGQVRALLATSDNSVIRTPWSNADATTWVLLVDGVRGRYASGEDNP